MAQITTERQYNDNFTKLIIERLSNSEYEAIEFKRKYLGDFGFLNSPFSKETFKLREYPFLIVVPQKIYKGSESQLENFLEWAWLEDDDPQIRRYYFGDLLE
jgi:hypothetical protein